uniref:Beta-microseminoprotein n=1 Tax=Pelusios castaneus TaxID=367368 RepID=A0A8C8RM40_9SAUR
MKCFLGVLFALGIWVTICDADCHFELNDPQKGCVQDGKSYAVGATWTKECKSCHCSKEAIQCCADYGIPVDYDEQKCERIFDKDSCSYSVVQKDDHSKTCPFTGMVG